MEFTALRGGGNAPLHRPGHGPADVLADVQIDRGVVQAALTHRIGRVEHQRRHHEVGA